MHSRYPDPHDTDCVHADTVPNVGATAAGVVALKGDGNRIGVWFSLVAASSLTAVQYVLIGVRVNGQFRALAGIADEEPYAYLDIGRYGALIQQELEVLSPDANTTVSVGFLRKTESEMESVEQTTGR